MLFVIESRDNVATALKDITPGVQIPLMGAVSGTLTVAEPIPRGHKVALIAIASGHPVVKHGYPVAIATEDIFLGSWVHSHNVVSPRDHTKEVAAI